MSQTLYLECYSGISGDMTVASLLDLGADESALLHGIDSLGLEGYSIDIYDCLKNGIKSKKFDVLVKTDSSVSICHRNLKDIKEVIFNSRISDSSKRTANKIFTTLAEAEAKVHGVSAEEVHFHEVGAVDSIIDIVGTAICLDDLGIEDVVISSISEGKGCVKCEHGTMPVPVPAVVELVSTHNLDICITDNVGEMITPTGAAIAASIRTMESLPSQFSIKRAGIGAGTKDFDNANILRAFLLDVKDNLNLEEEIVVLECNIDDMTGEELGRAMELTLEEGALDSYFIPVFMKKNRPAYIFSAICRRREINRLKEVIFKHTTTLGIREYDLRRHVMKRANKEFCTSFGNVRVKKSSYGDIVKSKVEYEDLKSISQRNNLSIRETAEIISKEIVNLD